MSKNVKMRRAISVVLMLVITGVLSGGCGKKENANTDYSKYGFTDITWTRTTEADTEYITFYADGSFSYYCACGDPVNDSDLCEGYTYDDKTKKIELNCSETTDTTVTTIVIKDYDENNLELDFDGDVRKFSRKE